MKPRPFVMACILLLVGPWFAGGQESEEPGELEDELSLQDDDQFPDLVRADESGGIIDEFSLLEETLSADEVESASKHRQPLLWSPSAISVFTREDIRASGAFDIPDLLRRVPGYDVYRAKPGFPLVGARTLTRASSNLVLVTIDGMEDLFEITGFAFWNCLLFDLEEVERVEVIRGPGSALYGANAFASVVSITTVADRPDTTADVYLSGGDQQYTRLFGRVRDYQSLGEGTLSYGLGLGMEHKGLLSDRSDEAIIMLRSQGHLRYRQGKWLDLALYGGVGGGDMLVPFYMGDMRVYNAIHYFIHAKAEMDLSDSQRLKVQFFNTRYGSDFLYRAQFRAYDIWIADIPPMYWVSRTFDGQVQHDWQITDDVLLISGGNIRFNTLDWDTVIISEADEVRGAGFVHLEWTPWTTREIQRLQLTAGVRYDFNTSTDPALSPRLVAVAQPFLGHTLRLGYGLAFRRPSYYETRVHAPIEKFNPATPEVVDLAGNGLGNPDLGNELVHSFEAGWRGRFLDDRLQTSLDLFYNLYRDTIAFRIEIASQMGLPNLRNSIIRFENEGAEVDALGGEAEIVWLPSEKLRLWGNLGFRHVTYQGSSKVVRAEPQWRINLGGRFVASNGLHLDAALHYVSHFQAPLIDPANVLENPTQVELGGTLLLITRLGYRVSLGQDRKIEMGLSGQIPLTGPFHEYLGSPMPLMLQTDSGADLGGEQLARLLTVYLRASF